MKMTRELDWWQGEAVLPKIILHTGRRDSTTIGLDKKTKIPPLNVLTATPLLPVLNL
jgi:hypothetical protein